MTLSYDTIVNGLIVLGWSRAIAEERARSMTGRPAPVVATRDAAVREKEEQAEVTKLFRAHGCTVRNLSQARATKQAPGLPDLWVTHNRLALAFWWETKRQVGGRLSPAQEVFRDDCVRCGVGWGSGDRYAAAEYIASQCR